MHNTNLACYMIGEVAADSHSPRSRIVAPLSCGQDAGQHRHEAFAHGPG